MRRVWVSLVGSSLVAAALVATAGSASAIGAMGKPPKVGQCYDYNAAQMASPSPTRGPVSCNRMHNSVVFRVPQWTAATAPSQMTPEEVYAIAESLCMPFPATLSKAFNYWGYFVPTVGQWNAGQRWIRCDALVRVSENPDTFLRWAGPPDVG